LSQLTGGGAIETFCPKCGFAYRQTTARPVPRQEHLWFRIARSLPNPAQDWSERPGFRLTWGKALAIIPIGLFGIALRALYVGYPSYEPVMIARWYVLLFSAVVWGIPTFVWTARRIEAWQVTVAFFVGYACALLFTFLAPRIGEMNYCGDSVFGWDLLHSGRVPPRIFRCTSEPFFIAGGFAGWWLAARLFNWWNSRER
jgi:hypothetical protein